MGVNINTIGDESYHYFCAWYSFFRSFYCQSLTSPSQPQVARVLGNRGCHAVSMHGPLSWAWNLRKALVVFQSHTCRRPLRPRLQDVAIGREGHAASIASSLVPTNVFFFKASLCLPDSCGNNAIIHDWPAKCSWSGCRVQAGMQHIRVSVYLVVRECHTPSRGSFYHH